MVQGIANAAFSASQTALMAVGLTLMYAIGRFLNFSHGATFAVGAYASLLLVRLGAPSILGFIGGVGAAAAFSVFFERVLFRRLRARESSPLTLLIASLGLFIVVQSGVALLFGESVKVLRVADVVEGHRILGAYVTGVQLLGTIGGILLCATVCILAGPTEFGRTVRATATDRVLARAVGVDAEKIQVRVAFVAAVLAGFAGIVSAYDVDIRPTMGFQPLLLAVVAMLVGGRGSPAGACGGAILVATVQQVSVAYLPSQWQDTVIFAVLAVVLFVRPHGVSRNAADRPVVI